MGLKNNITYSDIINKIGCEEVFKHYFGNFTLSDAYNSVLRTDNKKSTGFYVTKNGNVVYHDFSTGDKYNCVKFVSKLKGISFYDAIQDIAKTFSLTEGTGERVPSVIKPKQKSIFKVYTRPFTKLDLIWWGKYHITKEELEKYHIYSVAQFDTDKYSFITKKNELRFAYLFKEGAEGYFKIYTPTDLDRKWYFNGRNNIVFGLEELGISTQPSSKREKLIVTKSVKDYIVLKKFFPDVIALQNESKGAISQETIELLRLNYKHIIVFFDMDRPGVKSARHFYKIHKWYPFFIGNRNKNIWQNLKECKKEGVKDPSDFIKKYGLEKFESFLKKYKILK